MSQPIWNTSSGSIGGYPSAIAMSFQLSATPVAPATTVTYTIISGSLPDGISMDERGLISGTTLPSLTDTTTTFVVRATDNNQNIKDRTFQITISGSAIPEFVTLPGNVITTIDSTWIEIPIEYSTQSTDVAVSVRLVSGSLPPGVEINEEGIIRGYAAPPIATIPLAATDTFAYATNTDNTIVCFSTDSFVLGRPIVFSGTVFGGIILNTTYYIKEVINSTTFTISESEFGPEFQLQSAVGQMIATLPAVNRGEPTIRTYDFSLKLESLFGSDIQAYSITIINQNAPRSVGGPGYPPNTRVPTLLNTRPDRYDIRNDDQYSSFYLLPDITGNTYAPSQFAYIGTISSDNLFSFKLLGKDFDGDQLEYIVSPLPLGLTVNSTTGWITGNPVIAPDSIGRFNFSVTVRKASSPYIFSPSFNFTFDVKDGINGVVTWNTPSQLPLIYSGTVSTLSVSASADVDLQYYLLSGNLPPNLTLMSNGDISGIVSYQPTQDNLLAGDSTDFSFTVLAYSTEFSLVQSSRTFTLPVQQRFNTPYDTVYIKCAPSIKDRLLIRSLLDNTALIPDDTLYRENDPYFGKASSIIYDHAYGISSSSLDEYIAAITINHYWRNITLGELKTAVAKDDDGNPIYEVVYSSVIDNLVNPMGESVSKSIYWPRPVPLGLGPWYTADTDIFTSYIGDDAPPDEYFTSLTPGSARTFYPNSLDNMRQQVGDVLGQSYDQFLLPRWMTSQQANGSTLGYTPAWVICYTKPGLADSVKTLIETEWKDDQGNINTLNKIDFKIDRIMVNKSLTYNYDNNLSPPAWTALPSATPVPDPIETEDLVVLFPRMTILPDQNQN